MSGKIVEPTRGPFPVELGPLQHGLWLSKDQELAFVLLLSSAVYFGALGFANNHFQEFFGEFQTA